MITVYRQLQMSRMDFPTDAAAAEFDSFVSATVPTWSRYRDFDRVTISFPDSGTRELFGFEFRAFLLDELTRKAEQLGAHPIAIRATKEPVKTPAEIQREVNRAVAQQVAQAQAERNEAQRKIDQAARELEAETRRRAAEQKRFYEQLGK